jgi:hypothetical protein
MFNLFGKKKSSVLVKDLIWLTEEGKLKAILNECKKNNDTVIAVWFDNTYRKLETLLTDNELPTANIYIVRELTSHYLKNNLFIFAEHYPLRNKEDELFEKLGLSEVVIYSALDESLLTYFGGDRISDMVKQLGMKEDEPLQHKLIASSIKNAQEKIAGKVTVEQTANSPSDWFLYNLGKHSL